METPSIRAFGEGRVSDRAVVCGAGLAQQHVLAKANIVIHGGSFGRFCLMQTLTVSRLQDGALLSKGTGVGRQLGSPASPRASHHRPTGAGPPREETAQGCEAAGPRAPGRLSQPQTLDVPCSRSPSVLASSPSASSPLLGALLPPGPALL